MYLTSAGEVCRLTTMCRRATTANGSVSAVTCHSDFLLAYQGPEEPQARP
jgi:hypothetical protein